MRKNKTLRWAIAATCIVILLSSCAGRAPDNRTPEEKAYSRGSSAFKKKRYAQAITQMRPLAEKGYKNADYLLGMSYLLARSPHQNSPEGLKLVEKAASRGYPAAEMSMGVLFTDGIHQERDLVKAEKWFRKSIKNGNKTAKVGLTRIRFLHQLENGPPKSQVPKNGCVWLVDRFARNANVFVGTCSKDATEAFQDFSERHARNYAKQKMRPGHWARILSSGTKKSHRLIVRRYFHYGSSSFEFSTRRVR